MRRSWFRYRRQRADIAGGAPGGDHGRPRGTAMQPAAAAEPWSDADRLAYAEDGYVLRRGLLAPREVDGLLAEMPRLLGGDDADGLHRERERTGAVRQVYLAHRHSAPYRALAADRRLAEPARRNV